MCVTELGVMRSIPSVQGGYVIMREEIYGVVWRGHFETCCILADTIGRNHTVGIPVCY